jgi:dTDP-4-dehydrorhamnose 3,5-epimerase
MPFKVHVENDRDLPEVLILTPDVFEELRGEIWTSYNSNDYDELIPCQFNHDKFSISKKNVLRGIHGDNKSWKLISCPMGDILAVIVDLREGSDNYLKHKSFNLNSENKIQLLIPPGFGNSFLVNSDVALYHYKLAYEGKYIDAGEQFTVAWNDPRLGIKWPIEEPILSNRDARL